MAINLATKYSDKILTIFTQSSIMKGLGNNDYSFEGVKTVKIYTPVTVPLTDYTRSGSNRYGTPVDMQDTIQELTMTQDRSFSFVLDKGNNVEQLNIKKAGQMLRLTIDERVIPEYDKYVLGKLTVNAGLSAAASAALTKSNIAETIAGALTAQDNKFVPQTGRDHSDPVDQVQHAAPVPRVYRQRPSGQDQPGEGSGGRIHELPCG